LTLGGPAPQARDAIPPNKENNVANNDDLDNILFKFDITSTDVAMVRQAGTLIDDTLDCAFQRSWTPVSG